MDSSYSSRIKHWLYLIYRRIILIFHLISILKPVATTHCILLTRTLPGLHSAVVLTLHSSASAKHFCWTLSYWARIFTVHCILWASAKQSIASTLLFHRTQQTYFQSTHLIAEREKKKKITERTAWIPDWFADFPTYLYFCLNPPRSCTTHQSQLVCSLEATDHYQNRKQYIRSLQR